MKRTQNNLHRLKFVSQHANCCSFLFLFLFSFELQQTNLKQVYLISMKFFFFKFQFNSNPKSGKQPDETLNINRVYDLLHPLLLFFFINIFRFMTICSISFFNSFKLETISLESNDYFNNIISLAFQFHFNFVE